MANENGTYLLPAFYIFFHILQNTYLRVNRARAVPAAGRTGMTKALLQERPLSMTKEDIMMYCRMVRGAAGLDTHVDTLLSR